MELVVFVVGAAICLFGAAGVVFSRNPVHSALSLVATLFGGMTAPLAKAVYVLVGLSALYQGLQWKAIQHRWGLVPTTA